MTRTRLASMPSIIKRLLAVAFVVALAAANADAANTTKFHPVSAVEPAVGRYLVTLSELASLGDLSAVSTRLAAQYGGRLEPYAREGFRGFLVTMNPSRARMLSDDARVAAVEEMASANETRRDAPQAPPAPSTEAGPAPAVLRTISNTGGTTFTIGAFSYDQAGNVTTINGSNGLEIYEYDRFFRLKKATLGSQWQEYTHDRYGNIKTIRTAAGPERRLGVDPLTNQIDQATDPVTGPNNVIGTYDLAGNQQSLQWSDTGLNASFTYDGLNTVTESVIAGARRTYLYTAADERIASFDVTTGAQQWTVRNPGGQVLSRFTRASGTSPLQWQEDYVYRGVQMLAAYVAGPEKVLHFHTDHLGTPRLITGNGGAKIAEHRYYPFGEQISARDQDAELKKFTGHERDVTPGAPSADVDYMHARFYAVAQARFLTVDPGDDWDLLNPQSWNLYTYVRNNPVLSWDPTGTGTAEITIKPPSNRLLKIWTAAQRAAENAKNALRAELAEQGKLIINSNQKRPSTRQMRKANGGPGPKGTQMDHPHDLVLNGPRLKGEPLDASVNMSQGARLGRAIKGLAEGTKITKVRFTVLPGISIFNTVTQALSYVEFMQNQETAHPGIVIKSDMMRWVVTGETAATPLEEGTINYGNGIYMCPTCTI